MGKALIIKFLSLALIVFGVVLRLSPGALAETGEARGPIEGRGPARIIALSFASAELVRLMGAADRLVGVADNVKLREDLIPEAGRIPGVGRGFEPDLETIARLRPELVIGYANHPGPGFAERMEALGIAYLSLDFYLPASFPEETRLLSRALGGEAPERAEKYLSWMRNHEEKALKIISEANPKRPRVLMEHFVERRILGSGTGGYELSKMTGVINLASSLPKGFSSVDEEWVIKQNPDIFVKMVSLPSFSDEETKKKLLEEARLEIMGRIGWEDMEAIKSGRVYAFDTDYAGGPRYIAGLYLLASWFYPELFKRDLFSYADREYLWLFQGLGSPGDF